VLLHGFGHSHAAWTEIADRLDAKCHLMAYDLPGHARSLGVPYGSATVAAKAVLADLKTRGIAQAHLVGHSMGGAVAALVALREPPISASLSLLAPGGFGPEIDLVALQRYAAAQTKAEIAAALAPFFAGPVPPGLTASLARERKTPGASEALATILDTFCEDGAQKCLPLSDLARLSVPIAILWGAEDRILPAAQAQRLRAGFDVRILEGAGHMLPFEALAEIIALIEALPG
jgi:pimeloyl-ACP methyl ester carboxylesterase